MLIVYQENTNIPSGFTKTIQISPNFRDEMDRKGRDSTMVNRGHMDQAISIAMDRSIGPILLRSWIDPWDTFY